MKKLSSVEIRETWINFFKEKGHNVEESAPLVPIKDKTLLWINAGVAPLKKYFDGSAKPNNPRITNVQKCIRTNDIENVGATARHHTFFEMMGNFSIGDYFKQDIIPWAFELLTNKKYFDMPLDKLYFTVYDQDQDAYNAWVKLGVKESHLIKMDTNYWQIGTGPCGPCTEIFFDRGESFDKRGIELIKNDEENDRYIEIWNIVFSQFNAKENVRREDYQELPQKNIDTGAGLERFACVLQGVNTNYETDLFMPIINKIEQISGVKYESQMAFKVIADHVRTVTFALADGATFSNEGRGYVLRRVLRRAVKYAKKLNINKPFMHELVDVVVEVMNKFYPYLNDNSSIVKKMISQEEEKFLSTILKGEQKLNDLLKDTNVLSGESAFLLYDTFGFPIELTEEYAQELNKSVDINGFNECMQVQKDRARNARKNLSSMNAQNQEYLDFKDSSEFIGYDKLESSSKVIKVFEDGIVLDKTPFYAFSGGQLSDLGTINNFEVTDVSKLPNGQHIHFIEGDFKVGDKVSCIVDADNRNDIMKNHSATHLVQSALVNILGNHIKQQGSSVSSDYTRFDFNNFNSLTDEEIIKIEDLINTYIKDKNKVEVKEMNIEEANKLGATALFGEKYGDKVRVVNMGVSVEFCAGTHVKNTKDIEEYNIISVESIGSGTYRITGTTGNNIKEKVNNNIVNLLNELNVLNDKKEQLLGELKQYSIPVDYVLSIKDFKMIFDFVTISHYNYHEINTFDDEKNFISFAIAKFEKLRSLMYIDVSGGFDLYTSVPVPLRALNDINDFKESSKNLGFVLLLANKMKKYQRTEVYDNLSGYRYVLSIKKEIALLKDYLKVLNKELNDIKSKETLSNLDSYLESLDGNKLVIKVNNLESKETKELTDALLNKIGNGIVFIASIVDEKLVYVCKNNIDLDSGALIKLAASLSNGSGGGRRDMAQGGGKDLSKVDEVIASIKKEIA